MNGELDEIVLGNLDAKRDWGYAPEFVEAMWKIMQLDKPDDFVISTGESHTVREFVELAFKYVEIDITWKGENEDEVGIDSSSGKILVRVSPKYFRPSEVDILKGDSAKASRIIGWNPSVKFSELVEIMMSADLGSR